jgi:hypothetical protein
MPTFDVQGIVGAALTAALYPDRSDVPAETGIVLTESASRPGRFRGTTTRTGWHQVKLMQGSTVRGYWDVRLRDDVIAYGEDRDHSLWAPAGSPPVVVTPEPAVGQVAAYVICRTASGAPQQGVVVRCATEKVADAGLTGSAWSDEVQTATSNAQGVASFVLPAQTGLRHRAWRDNGEARLFSVGTDPVFQIPDLLG